MNPRARVPDLSARSGRRAILETGCAHRATHGLRDHFVGLAVGEPARPEALDRRVDEARIELVQPLPGETQPIEHAGREILHQDIRLLRQLGEDPLTVFALQIQRDAPLVAIEHRKVQAIDARQIAQLDPGDVTPARRFDLDDVGAQPGKNLGA